MKIEGSRSGLAILAGGLFFVGAANAVDIVVDGSYESSTNKITGFVGAGGDDNAGLDGGWTHFSTYTYSANYTQSGPPASGRVYLRPYADAASSQTVSQTNSLARAITTAQIDNLTGQYTLSAWFSTYKDQNDYNELTLQFLDSAMVNAGSPIPLGGAAFVAALPGGAGLRAWGRDTKTGIIPPGARYAAITTVSHAQVDLPDGYVDLVSLDITAGFVPVQVTSASPANNAANVKPEAILSVTLRDGTAPLNTNSIRLSYDNAPVTPSVQKSGTATMVQYDPPGLLTSLSPHGYEIAFNNAGDATPNTTNRYTFTVPYFHEDFETARALDDWSADNGIWEIGKPTFGPSTNSIGQRAFAGTNCAATILGGNYPENSTSRLVGPLIVVPTNQNPRLRFEHWFRFNAGDSGEVQIKSGTNDWRGISAVYGSTGGDVWSRVSVDLSAYAGKTVQIGFLFQSRGVICCAYNDVDAGWYIDEVSLVTGPIQFNNTESFESGWGDWSAEAGTWEVGVPTSVPGGAHTGANCAGTVLGGNYLERAGSANGVSSRLISPSFVVPSAGSHPRLRFWYWYTLNSGDSIKVQIKEGTNAWITFNPVFGAGYTGGGVWSQASIDLSAYSDKPIKAAFLFQASGVVCCGYNDTAAGVFVDDISLVTGPIFFSNPDSFETGFGDWSSDGGTWEVGVPASGPASAHTGTNCAATVFGGNYQERVGSANGAASRLISPPFVVPPAATNPRFRFWHWFAFNAGDSGQVQIKSGTNDWVTYSSVYVGTGGGVWSQPPAISLADYAGQRIQIGFWFQASGVVCCGYNETAAGWYIDDVRLLHDFALVLLDSPIVRTQNTACVSLAIAAGSPVSTASFALHVPIGHLDNVTLSTEGCWADATFTPQGSADWLVRLQNGCTNAPVGLQTIGSLCFTAVSLHSAFVPLTINNLVVTNVDGSIPVADAFGSRPVVIANEPLLQATMAPNRQRTLALFGKRDTRYEIQYAEDLGGATTWAPVWTNSVPTNMSYSFPIEGSFSNRPSLYLRALEK